MAFRKVLAVSVSVITCNCVIFLTGCGSSSDESATEKSQDAANPAAEQNSSQDLLEKSLVVEEEKESPTKFSAVLSAWDSGDKDESVRQLLQVNWDDPTAFVDMPILGITEQNFSSLGPGERADLQNEAMKLAGTAKNILRHAFVLAEQQEAEGNKQAAKKHYEGVQNLGKTLANPERLAVLQMMGKGLVEMSQEKIDAVD